MERRAFQLDHWLAKYEFRVPLVRYDLASSTRPRETMAELLAWPRGELSLGKTPFSYLPPDGTRAALRRCSREPKQSPNLTTADISDSAGAQAIVAAVRKCWPWLKHLFADGANDRTNSLASPPLATSHSRSFAGATLSPASRCRLDDGSSRTFGSMTRWRRLVRDCEQRLDVSDAMIHVAFGSLLLHRIAHP